MVLPAGSGHYLLAFDDSRVVVGATREPEAGFGYRVTAAGLSRGAGAGPGRGPGPRCRGVPGNPGGLPTGGPGHPAAARPGRGVPGLVIATGLGAEGLTMGPHAGGIAARAALGLDPGTDLTPFDPLR